MSAKTGIEWTDATWNPVVGCTKVSQGCKFCYAKTIHDMRHKAHLAGKTVAPQYAQPFETVQLKPERLTAPLSWRAPRRVFVNSVSDLFHDDVPDDYLDRVFAVMAMASRHTFQVLTKRSARMRAYLADEGRLQRVRDTLVATQREVGHRLAHADHVGHRWPLRNVWLGVSVENQEAANERIPLLLQTPAAVRFLSCEPLLGPVTLTSIPVPVRHGVSYWNALTGSRGHGGGSSEGNARIDWVIPGGESGKNARRFELNWGESLIDQCKAAGVAVFMKQIGANATLNGPDFPFSAGGHGGDMERWPNQLRVREFPSAEAPV